MKEIDQTRQGGAFMNPVHFRAALQRWLLNWLSPMHELSSQPGRRGMLTRQAPTHRTGVLPCLIILPRAVDLESTVTAKREVTLVMSWGKTTTKTNRKPWGQERKEERELRNKEQSRMLFTYPRKTLETAQRLGHW